MNHRRMQARVCAALLGVAMLVFSGNVVIAGGYKVLGFEQALNIMMDHNPALSGKRAEVTSKGFASDSERAARYPSISAQAGYQNISSSIGSRNNNDTLLTAVVRQPLWAFGRIDSRIDYADADVLAGEADLLRVKRDLLGKTVTAYANVLAVYKKQQVIEDNITSYEGFYQKIKRREIGQLASKADSQLAFLRLIEARGQKKRLEGELSLALNELQSIIQVPVQKLMPITDDFALPALLGNVESMAVKNSAELQYKQRLLNRAEINVKREVTSGMPTIYFQVQRQFNSLGLGNGTSYSVLLSGGLDGLGLATFGRANAAVSDQVAAAEDLKVAHNDVIRKVRSLFENRALQDSLIQVQESSVRELHGIFISYMRQYEAGKKHWLEVLNIQREMTDQKLQLVQAESDKLVYSLQLINFLGGFDALAGTEKKKE